MAGAVADKPSDPASSALCQPPSPDAATLAEFQAFGTPGEVMMSIIELGALADAEADPLYVSASAIVFPDGRVRWYEMTVVPWTFGEHQERMRSRGAAVPAAAPQLAAAVAQLVEAQCADTVFGGFAGEEIVHHDAGHVGQLLGQFDDLLSIRVQGEPATADNRPDYFFQRTKRHAVLDARR